MVLVACFLPFFSLAQGIVFMSVEAIEGHVQKLLQP